MVNNAISRNRSIFLEIYNLLFAPTESQGVKQLKKNVAILMQNQKLQQSLVETNVQTNHTSRIHLAKNRYMINILVDALKSINDTVYEKTVMPQLYKKVPFDPGRNGPQNKSTMLLINKIKI